MLLTKESIKDLISEILMKGSEKNPIKVLEAGCGRRWSFNLKGIHLTGVDMDEHAINARVAQHNDLNEVIIGDLCSIELSAYSCDVIYCNYVLEHIKDADLVVKNFVGWLKEDGIIIIKVPDPNSVQGFMTKITPFWFHIYYYRYIKRIKNAGMPGYAPYPTFYNPIISLKGMKQFCNDMNMTMVAYKFDEDERIQYRKIIYYFKRMVNILSLRKLAYNHSGLLFIIRKNYI